MAELLLGIIGVITGVGWILIMVGLWEMARG
jgi:hypothetical protein